MNQLFIVYKTDVHHTYASRNLLGIGTTLPAAIRIVRQQVKKEEEPRLPKDQMYNLEHIKQTQGYSGEGEFQIEPVSKNILL